MSKDFTAERAGQSNGRDFPGSSVEIDIMRSADVVAPVRQIYGPFSIARKIGEKLRTEFHGGVGLSTGFGHRTGYTDVKCVLPDSAKGVTWKVPRLTIHIRENHSRIESACQGDGSRLSKMRVAGQ